MLEYNSGQGKNEMYTLRAIIDSGRHAVFASISERAFIASARTFSDSAFRVIIC